MSGRLDGNVLPDLAAVLREEGLPIDETVVPNWRQLSRGGNTQWYKPGLPSHLMLHDTATPASVHKDLASERREAARMPVHPEARPCSNLYIGGTTGTCFLICGGPANTNGAGHDWWGGGVPDDAMNTYSIAIEYGNDGVGEPYQDEPFEIYMRACKAIDIAYGIPVAHDRCHFEWAPTRKINLSSGPGYAGAAARFVRSGGDRYGRLDMDKVRGYIASLILADHGPADPATPIPTTPHDPQEDTVDKILVRHPNGQMFVTDLVSYAHACSEDEGANLRDNRGASVHPNTGPWPLVNPVEADFVLKIAD